MISYVLIAGEDEFKNGKFNLKKLKSSVEKKSLSPDEIMKEINGGK